MDAWLIAGVAVQLLGSVVACWGLVRHQGLDHETLEWGRGHAGASD